MRSGGISVIFYLKKFSPCQCLVLEVTKMVTSSLFSWMSASVRRAMKYKLIKSSQHRAQFQIQIHNSWQKWPQTRNYGLFAKFKQESPAIMTCQKICCKSMRTKQRCASTCMYSKNLPVGLGWMCKGLSFFSNAFKTIFYFMWYVCESILLRGRYCHISKTGILGCWTCKTAVRLFMWTLYRCLYFDDLWICF